MKYQSIKGFTLAELLTVVIIIGLLAALATGYYKKSVEQSRFGEGLMAGAAIVEGINQAYFDEIAEGVSPSAAQKARKIKTLPISAGKARGNSCATPSDYCVATKHFEITTDGDDETGSIVYAYRGTESKYRYYLDFRTSYSTFKDRVACVGVSTMDGADAKAFCESMGYTQCSPTYICTKP